MSNESPRRPGERRSGDQRPGSNWLWYLAFGLLIGLVGLIAIVSNGTHNVAWTDFNRLVDRRIEELGRGSGVEAAIDVDAKREGGKRYRYSRPHDLQIGDRDVRGRIVAQVIDEAGAPIGESQTVAFVVRKDPSDTVTARLFERLDQAQLAYDPDGGPDFFERYGFLIVMTILLLVALTTMFRKLGGAGSAMSFSRSRGKLYAQEDLGVTFDDVAGIDEAVEEVREVVDFLKNAEKYHKLGGRIPKGVLLVGPPGTGKTLLAKAIAGEAGVPFFSLSGSDFVEMFVGVGAARVRDLFQQAEAKAPCIIFIDELDALGKARGSGLVSGHDEREQTLNALLVQMDGFDSNAGVIVMAATNRPETLDQALLRPGRFDRNVLVDRPDVRGREAILKVHVKNVKLDPSVDLKHIASITSGFVGADLANLVNESALLAARAGRESVGSKEFDDAVERVTAGLEKKQRVMSDDEKERIAYHEAGHALVAYSLPNTDPVHKVSIIPRGVAALGYTMQRPEADRYLVTQSELESQLQILLAGTLAEELVFHDISTGAQNDLERVTDLARAMVVEFGMSRLGRINYKETRRAAFLSGSVEDTGRVHSEATSREIDREVRRIIDQALANARCILELRRDALETLTRRLIEVEAIDSREFEQIMQRSIVGPRVVPGTLLGPERRGESTEARRARLAEAPSDDDSASESATG